MMLCKKTRFANELEADNFIIRLKQTQNPKKKKRPQSSYLCPKCLSWHLTSQDGSEYDLVAKLRKDIKEKNTTISELNDRLHQKNETIKDLKHRLQHGRENTSRAELRN